MALPRRKSVENLTELEPRKHTHRRSVSFQGDLETIMKDVISPINTDIKGPVVKSTDSTPRSNETTPRSNESSPRRTLKSVVQKLIPKKQSKVPEHIQLYDEHGRELGQYHYELFEYAINGNLRCVKEIIDSGNYTQADIDIVTNFARKHGKLDIAFYLGSIH